MNFRVIYFASLCALTISLAGTGCSKTSKGGAGDGTDADGGISDQELSLQEQKRWGDDQNIPRATAGGPFDDIRFEFNSSVVGPEYADKVARDAEALRSDSSLRAEIEGHCDRRGTTEFNMALGERRARAVAAALASNGVKAEQLSIVSYGEEIPLDPSDSEAAYAKNRRAHFAVYRQGENSKF